MIMKRLICILPLLLFLFAARAEKKSVLRHVEECIASCKTYSDLYYVSCDNDTSLCLIDSLNLLTEDADLHRLLKQGNGIQRTAAFVLICTRTENLNIRRQALKKVIIDTTQYSYLWSDDIISDMSVGGYCFSLARQQGWATNEQYAEYVSMWDKFGTWKSSKEACPDESGLFTRKLFVSSPPEFPGGQSALFKYLAKNVNYPTDCTEHKACRVICQFMVNTDGSITDTEVVRGCDDEYLEAEAIRVISNMPKWRPGTKCHQPVQIKYTVPIVFHSPED